MGLLILPERRTRQPRGLAPIDWGNPITQNLILSLPLSAGSGYRSSTRSVRQGVPTAVASTVTLQGTAANFVGTGFIDLGATPFINSARPFTLALYETVGIASALATLCGFALSNGQQWVWVRGTNVSYNSAAGPAPSIPINFTSAGAQTAGEKIRWLVTGTDGMGAGTGMRMWANGVEQNGAGTTFGSVAASTNYIGWDGSNDKWQGAIQDVNLWGRVLSDAEIAAYFANPNQVYAPEPRRLWLGVAAAGGATHATTGALGASVATIAGTASHLILHASTGALIAPSAAVAGTATRITAHPSSGALAAGAAAVAGAASRLVAHPSTGALAASASAISGSAAHVTVHGAAGTLAASAATVAGAAARSTAGTHPTAGTLTGQSATVSAVASHQALHATAGALAGQPANIAGTAAHVTAHATAGALIAQAATIAGTALRLQAHSSIAALIAQSAIFSGNANRSPFGSSTSARPASDASNDGWLPSAGSALYLMVNEVVPSAAEYIYATSPGKQCEMALSVVGIPGGPTQQLQFSGSSSTGNGVIVRLKNTGGATVRVIGKTLTPVDTLYSVTLSAGEAAAITSGALSVQLESD